MTAPEARRQRLGPARLRAITPHPSNEHRAWPYYSAGIWSLVAVESSSCPGLAVDERWRLFVRPRHVLSTPVPALADQLIHLITHLLRCHPDWARALGVHTEADGHRWLVASDMESNDDLHRDGHTTLSPCTYRSHCRPGTGTASRNCQPGTGATVSSMNRDRTPSPCDRS